MEKASEDLINEHKAVLLTLKVLEKICSMLQMNKEVDYRDINDIISFLKIFVDKCHHGKEEEYLFPALEEAGIPNQGGPIGVMLFQHEQGREMVRKMKDSINDNSIDKLKFVDSAESYINLLRNHIDKENFVLFPMGDARLSETKQKELLKNFEVLEEEVIGKGKHEELHAMLKNLEKKYSE